MKYIIFLLILLTGIGCQPSETQNKDKDNPYPYYLQNINNQVQVISYNYEGDVIYRTFGVMLSPKHILTPIPPRKEVARVRIQLGNSKREYYVKGYQTINIQQGLYVIELDYPNTEFQKITLTDTLSTDLHYLEYQKRGVLSYNDTLVNNQFKYKIEEGLPLYNSKHQFVGIARNTNGNTTLTPTLQLRNLIDSLKDKEPKAITELKDEGVYYPPAKAVKGFLMETNFGNITLKLYDDMPLYKENFIRLVVQGYYDSLLIHRIIPQFLIQTGSPDTRVATAGDEVGNTGPGYMLPNKPQRKYFHKRGAIAASKLPFFANVEDKCDGGQFYIVQGRVFSAKELQKLEQEKNYKYNDLQKATYESTGGAPHLDGEYTVFGEVTQGMNVVEKISKLAIDEHERPLIDVRIKKIVVLMK